MANFLKCVGVSLFLFCGWVRAEGIEFFPKGWKYTDVQKFNGDIDDRVAENVNAYSGSGDFKDFCDIKAILASTAPDSQPMSGYERFRLFQEQIRFNRLKSIYAAKCSGKLIVTSLTASGPYKISDLQYDVSRALNDFFGQLIFNSLSDTPQGAPIQNFATINELLDESLKQLAEDNYQHTMAGGMVSPFYAITGLDFDVILDKIYIRQCREYNNGEISTPKDFGRITGVKHLADDDLVNEGFQLFRNILRSFFGDAWAWAALKLSKEELKFSLLAGNLDKACRLAAVASLIMDQAHYEPAATNTYTSEYYREFYAELAWLLSSTSPDMKAAKDLNVRYLKLDETKGTETDKNQKKRFNDLLVTSGRFLSEPTLFNTNPEAYAFTENMLEKMNQKKEFSVGEKRICNTHLDCARSFINGELERLGKTKRPENNPFSLEELQDNSSRDGWKVRDLWRNFLQKEFNSFNDLLRKDGRSDVQKELFDDIFNAYISLSKITYGFYDELTNLPAEVFAERSADSNRQNGTSDGEFSNSCFLCATHNNASWLNHAYGRRWVYNLYQLSGLQENIADFESRNQAPLLSNIVVFCPDNEFFDAGLHRAQVCFKHAHGKVRSDGSDERCIFESSLSSGKTVTFNEFIQSDKTVDKVILPRISNPLYVRRFFYNVSNGHFIGVSADRRHSEVLKLANAQQKMTLLTEDPNHVLNWLYYLMYGTPFTHRTVNEKGDWMSLQPEKPDYKEADQKSDKQRKLWEARFLNE